MKKRANGIFYPGKKVKFFLIMVKTCILLLLFSVQIQASVYSQQTKLSIKLENVSIQKLFVEIEKMSEFAFVYSVEDIKKLANVDVDFTNADIEEILEYCFENTGYETTVVDKHIIINKTPVEVEIKQEKEIKGKVTDNVGMPLPGATILENGTLNGVTSDQNGYFSITVKGISSALKISFIGFETQIIAVRNRTEINVVLIESAESLKEVVITGMQSRDKSTMIGSTSVIKSETLASTGVGTIDEAIKGQLAGVYVRGSGRPGEVGKIQIRGINTMTGNTNPLYILDGMPLQGGEVSGGISQLMTNGIGNIPPEDIESITILKDATAAAVYGSRAANGVVVITTKVGKAGKDYLTYSGKFGVTFRPDTKWDFMNSAEKVDFELGIYDDFTPQYGGRAIQIMNKVNSGVISQTDADIQLNALKNTNTNWINEIYRPAYTQSHNVTMSGGSAKMQYHASINYQNSQGTLKGNNYKKGGMNLKLSRYVTDNLLIKFSLYTTLKQNKSPNGMDPYRYAVFANPYEKPYNVDGSYSADKSYLNLGSELNYLRGNYMYTDFNIMKEMEGNTLTNTYGNIRGQLGIEYSFLQNFRYIGQAVYEYTSTHDIDESLAGTYRAYAQNWLNPTTEYGKITSEFNRGFLKEYMGRNSSYTVRNTLEFNKKFGANFLQLFAANEVSQNTNYRFNHLNPIYDQFFRIAGYPLWADINGKRYSNLKLDDLGGTYYAQDRSVSFIGSAVYSYDDKYVANLNIRYDGVDILGSDNQFSPIWSMGLKWNAHNEKFMEQYEHIFSRLVFSAGFGYRGSINRSVFPFHSYDVSPIQYGGFAKAKSFTYGNPVLKWEKKKELNLGLELSLFKGMINIEARYFNEKTVDLLDQLILQPSVGRPTATVNVGSLSNKGFELSARFQAVKKKDLLVEVSANITKVTNKLDDVFTSDLPNSISTVATRNIEGYPINSWFGYKFSHINPETGAPMIFAQKETISTVNGEVVTTLADELLDLSKITSQTLTSNYRTYHLGQKNPDLFGGFSLLVKYKAFDLTAYFTYASGNTLVKFNDRNQGPDGNTDDISSSRTNRLVNSANRWRSFGDITDIPAYSRNRTNFNNYLIDSDLEDGSYLKLTNISIGWRAPSNLLKNTFIKTLKASLIASNLFTWSNYSGSDPEIHTPFGYPNSKSITFSINVGL
jgi:TonB-linked SusC/RagA family outer membrane protein